jgi:glycosyltransferase involved in cell wall biosynthesis
MGIGVSVVICCYNSAKRLPQTLSHLAVQEVTGDVCWEVVVVDNASTDNTARTARECWAENSPAPLRVVYEPRLGLSYARQRGFADAKYELVSFVDDDNWVCHEWVQIVAEVMSRHPDVGACGGFSGAVCEIQPPWWFECNQGSYAVGAQGNEARDVTWTRGYLWGAGLTVRKSAWQQLVSNGFRFLLVDRQGASLTTGGDLELCFALRLAGYRLWYEPRLRLRHFLPAHRLEWNYMRRLHRALGACSVGGDPYYFALIEKPKNLKERLRQTWQWQTLACLKELFRQPRKLLLAFCCPLEGDPDLLWTENRIGRLFELLQKRSRYDLSIPMVQNALYRSIA